MQFTRKEEGNFSKSAFKEFIIGGDIGGTHSHIGLFGMKNKRPQLIATYHFRSARLDELDDAMVKSVEDIKAYFGIKVSKACLGVAGVVSEKGDRARITNVHWDVDAKRISKKTGIKIKLINDFEAIGFSINSIKSIQIKTIKNVKTVQKAPITVIGAGTGLGKSTLAYDGSKKMYVPYPSEAGHMDFAPQNMQEFRLAEFIKKHNKITSALPFEYVLSGKGITNIFKFLMSKFRSKHMKEIRKSGFSPSIISKYHRSDILCKKTFGLFSTFYARFARNCALESLPFGGLYIAGGIAPKNMDIFNKEFIKEFENSYRHSHVLKKIPIFIVKDLRIGMMGAASAV